MTDQELNVAAQEGNIDHLYTIIQQDPHVLERVDAIPFVDTPLHTAASSGHLEFATEIMRLKPSFALKLNQQGYSPIHLALQHGQTKMALRFADINKDLVRVKGREGLTPLHFVSRSGELELLAYFLKVCPQSIEDVTVRSETAVHIALKNQQYRALQFLVRWLKKNYRRGASSLQSTILCWKDKEGDNILHVSVRLNNLQALELLIESGMNLNAMNLENSTALDIASSANAEIRNTLLKAGAKSGSWALDAAARAVKPRWKIRGMDKAITRILRIGEEITEQQRNAYLVVVALVVTAIYQTVLSPPGGFYQADAGADNTNTTGLNSTATSTSIKAGKSVLSEPQFIFLWTYNTFSLVMSCLAICVLMPSGVVNSLVSLSLYVLCLGYYISVEFISPSSAVTRYFNFCLFPPLIMPFILWFKLNKWKMAEGGSKQGTVEEEIDGSQH